MPKRKARRDSREKLGRHQAKLHLHSKLPSSEEPDVSSILKVPGTGQTEEPDDLFDHPLHSTAVSAYEEEEEEMDKDQCSEPDGSTSNSADSEPAKKITVKSKNHPTRKSRVGIEDSEEEPVKENMRSTEVTPSAEECKLPSALSLRNSSPESRISDRFTDFVTNLSASKMSRRAKSYKKKKASSPEIETDYADSCDDPHLVKVWDPKGLKKVASHVTQLDVILDEFEKITTKYKQGVKLKICRKAIDNFYIGFRDQLTKNITDAEELKNIKLKNAKMVKATNKKRQRLIEVKEELIRTEPQLKKLEREYAELKGKISSVRNAVQLVTDLKDLQQKHVNERKESSQKIVYGVSSLPALLVESRRILGAEGHFRNINTKLQQSLDLQKEN
ncbi:centromere protein U [Elgaria multicarinata webbii]|uniref:centromere protein U n=1 Tax=Elgaria multicarinata webbii TaxID=159646 RepID=UPI002FCD2428